MFNKVRFQTKLLLTYSTFIIILLSFLGIVFYQYNLYLFENNVEDNLNKTTDILIRQLDNAVREMDGVASAIGADPDVIKELTRFYEFENQVLSNDNLFNNSALLQERLESRAANQGDIYRASIFNSNGNIISTKQSDGNKPLFLDKIHKFAWLDSFKTFPENEFYIREPHYDDWLQERHVQVLSLVRRVYHDNALVGLVEIQQRADKLNQICDIENSEKEMIAVINDRRKVVYSSWKLFSNVLINHYRNIARESRAGTVTANNPFSKLPEVVSYQHSQYTGWTIFIIQNKKELFAPLASVGNITFIVIFGIIAVSILVLAIFASKLTVPLRHLKEEMEKINMDNLPGEYQLIRQSEEHENNEIAALNSSFNNMRERLNQAMKMEIKSRSLQLKAHFDALQSQINPHFLYNILGVIPTIGDEDEILDACLKLADMLRYSTSNMNSQATVRDEITHASNYLTLMKKRFEHRLEYTIEVDEAIMSAAIPKLIIQPLIENSISHGFDNAPQPVMRVGVKAFRADNQWFIRIDDNGSGFEEDVLDKLQARINKYADSLLANKDREELEFGGMGLVNTFARLLLFYGQQMKFELKNNETGGARIEISGLITEAEQDSGKGDKNV